MGLVALVLWLLAAFRVASFRGVSQRARKKWRPQEAATVRESDPEDCLLDEISHAYASEIDRPAIGASRGKHLAQQYTLWEPSVGYHIPSDAELIL